MSNEKRAGLGYRKAGRGWLAASGLVSAHGCPEGAGRKAYAKAAELLRGLGLVASWWADPRPQLLSRHLGTKTRQGDGCPRGNTRRLAGGGRAREKGMAGWAVVRPRPVLGHLCRRKGLTVAGLDLSCAPRTRQPPHAMRAPAAGGLKEKPEATGQRVGEREEGGS